MRILLQLVAVLSGLLMAREFLAHSNEHLRLVLRWAKVVSESITTVHEPPALAVTTDERFKPSTLMPAIASK